jgi:hypothetical protein
MSQGYRLLGEGIPGSLGLGPTTFVADARRARGWIAALPRANGLATQQSLAGALDSLAGQKLDGGTRLAVLEELRIAICETIGLLKREFAGSSLPLAPAKAAAARQVEGFHVALAQGYRRAAVEFCAPSGNVPMLRGGAVAQALARAAWHYAQALSLAWRVYRAPAAGVWQGLHRVHGFAVEARLDAKRVDDAIAGAPVEVRNVYLQALLMAITHPLAFSQAEQDVLWQVSADFAPRCALTARAPQDNAPVVPEDADRGPGPGVVGETATRWLDMAALTGEVDAALMRERDGASHLMPPRGPGVRVSTEMLRRLQRSFGLSAARTHRRLPATHGMRSVFGLSALHFHLAGQRDFDAFMRHATQRIVHQPDRANWVGGSGARVPVHETQVLDQSLGGYRLAWEHADQIRARVGELVGLTLSDGDETPEWMLGVIRWLRYENDGGLSAGVELLARNATAVGLRLEDGSEPLRALQMDAMGPDGEMHFLAPNTLDCGATRIEVVRDDSSCDMQGAAGVEEMLAGVDVLLNAGDYALLRPLRADLVDAGIE